MTKISGSRMSVMSVMILVIIAWMMVTMMVTMMTTMMMAMNRTRNRSLAGRKSMRLFFPFCEQYAVLYGLHLLHKQMDGKFYFQYAFSIDVV